MRKLFLTLGLATLPALASTACAPPLLYVRLRPPIPIFETRILAPGPDYVWIPGFYRWDGGAYLWVAGRWERPPAHYHTWVPGRWERNRRGWYRVEGHWRR